MRSHRIARLASRSLWLATALALNPTGSPAPVESGGLAHFYYVEDAAAWDSLRVNVRRIGLLSPVWVHVESTGKPRIAIEERVRALAVQANVPLLPVVVNDGFRLEAARSVFDPARQRQLLDTLVRLAVAENFAGYQLDFENLEAADREPYSRLAEALAAALRPHGKQLSVAVVSPLYAPVAANVEPSVWEPTPRSAAFDYTRLASASSFLTLMTYDQYTSPDAPGPIAGLAWMEACARKLLEKVPASRLTLGIPLYHRRWVSGRVATGNWMEAQELAWKAKAGPILDTLHQELVLRFRSPEGVAHEVWFQNATSVQQRIRLAQQLGLRGYSAWRIGQEDPSLWTAGLTQGGPQP